MIDATQSYAGLNYGSGTSAMANVAQQAGATGAEGIGENPTREAFDQFVGGTFFRQLLSTMQKSVGKPAYMHGGQAEEMFRNELNSKLADQMAETTGSQFTGPMFDLFSLQRS
jgi:peptidoglycan hydrolase FlgJ